MKKHDIAQGSVDWLIARAGVVTASEVDALVSPTGKIRTGDGVKTYLHRKLTERWTGGPLPVLQGIFDVQQGEILEQRARPAFTIHTGIEVETVGFITSDDGRIGCSPDALIGNQSGCEIKCPTMPVQIGYLLGGQLPSDYIAQVQFSMYVTGCKTWHFFSYNRRLPPFHLLIERDEKYQDALHDALGEFLEALDDGMARLTKINGGPPPRPKPIAERTFANSTGRDGETLGRPGADGSPRWEGPEHEYRD